jgi:bone morphogenetic protein 7
MRPEDVGIVGFRGDPDKQPFMVGYFKSSGVRESRVRRKRDARRKKKSDSSNWDYQNNPYTGKHLARDLIRSQFQSRVMFYQT